jgi:hypothetical protein
MESIEGVADTAGYTNAWSKSCAGFETECYQSVTDTIKGTAKTIGTFFKFFREDCLLNEPN